MGKEIKLRYLPIFYDDVIMAIDYISNSLKNIKAADELMLLIKQKIEERRPIADSFHSFKSRKNHKYEYYKIKVKKYDIYYVLIHEENNIIMEVRRFLHSSMDVKRALL